LREDIVRSSMYEEIVGSSEPLHRVLLQVSKVAPTDSAVLVLGEAGAGEELIQRSPEPKSTADVFVPLNIYLLPRRQRVSSDELVDSAPPSTILKNEAVTHVVVLGQPGAGKTTAVKHLCQEMLMDTDIFPLQNFPLLIRLRDLNNVKHGDGDLEERLILNGYRLQPASVAAPGWLEQRSSATEECILR
jgi:hypothetical protein